MTVTHAVTVTGGLLSWLRAIDGYCTDITLRCFAKLKPAIGLLNQFLMISLEMIVHSGIIDCNASLPVSFGISAVSKCQVSLNEGINSTFNLAGNIIDHLDTCGLEGFVRIWTTIPRQ